MDRAVRLGEAVQQLMAERISPRQAKFDTVAEIWRQVLPAELCQHCEISGISGGQLKVQVDSPSYMYELQLCSCELLKELQGQCPKVRLTKIKFVVA
jgi:predicted nucleic acid-binding Zn ribbon protein